MNCYQANGSPAASQLANYCAYKDNTSGLERIGHLHVDNQTIRPLSFVSGTPISNLYQVIEAGEKNIAASGESFAASSVTILPPISGRDILAVGKNYAEHAKEFNKSGYDSSDKVDQPTYPVIFTKRATSIIADGEAVYPHPGFTKTLDYEGEIGVIVGEPGFRIDEKDAMNHVWGYTIINDMTARERQRDHKQFYIGKSPDTFCPMGPIAVPKDKLPRVLRVQTHVNGVLKQDATTEDLIFSIPFLIKTLSEGQTLQIGDVLATGTPAGVGIGKSPPEFLKSGDKVQVSVTGLGSLTNAIAGEDSANVTVSRVQGQSYIPLINNARSCNGVCLSQVNNKLLYYRRSGIRSGRPIVFVHGLGGTLDYFTPLIQTLRLEESHSLHSFDLEGHGLSPTSPVSSLTIQSFAQDVRGVFEHGRLSGKVTLVAHSMGCLIALAFVIEHPDLVSNLILIGPPPNPLPEAASNASYARAKLARERGMVAVVDAVVNAGTSERTKTDNTVGLTAVRLSLLGQDPEGYAKACTGLAGATTALPLDKVHTWTMIVTGKEDKVSPPEWCYKLKSSMQNCEEVVVLEGVGHWHVFEDAKGVSDAVGRFLKS